MRQAYIKQSVILNYQVCRNKTSGGCYIHTHCLRLPANVTATLLPPIGRMDGAMCSGRGGVCVWGAGGTGRCAYRKVGMSPSSPRSSLSHHTAPPPCGSDSRGPVGGRSTDLVRGGTRWSPAFDCARRRCCCNTTNSSKL